VGCEFELWSEMDAHWGVYEPPAADARPWPAIRKIGTAALLTPLRCRRFFHPATTSPDEISGKQALQTPTEIGEPIPVHWAGGSR